MSDSAKQKLDNIIRHDNIMGAPRSHWRRCCGETWRFRRWAWLKNWDSTRQSKFDRLKPTKPRLKKIWIFTYGLARLVGELYQAYMWNILTCIVYMVSCSVFLPPPKAWVSICKLFAAFLRSSLVFTRYLQHFWLPASHLLGICYLLDDLH